MRSIGLFLLLLIALVAVPVHAQPDTVCAGVDGLQPGLWARIGADFAVNRRAEATTRALIIGQIPAGDIFRLLDGPACADSYVWWQVDYAGSVGWAAQGSGSEDWMAALAGQDATASAENEPQGCLKPPDDYSRIWLGRAQLNLRTLAMLDHAQALYSAEGGIIRLREAIMQGSYNPGAVAASFGTHDGGGAVDLSVRRRDDFRVLTGEIEPLLRALRTAGFAAWLRDTDALYPGSPIHIHAIAIGDAELSEAARGQIDGTFGYLRGYDGLPREDGIPQPDTSGERVICGWMVELGFDGE